MTGAASTPDPWQPMHFVALRKARCETQAELAEAAEVAEHSVWMWESGRRTPTRPSTVRRLNGLLESLTPAQRERYDHELARLQEASGAPVAEAPPLAGDAPPAAKEHDDVNRRDAIFAALAAAGMTRKALWAPARAADPIAAGLIAAREEIMRALLAAYIGGDAEDLLPAATGFADGLVPLLRRAPSRELGLRTASLLVDAHGMAGVLASNVGDPLATLHHLTLASHVASFSGDPILKARAWALEAKHLYSPLVDGLGSARHAVALLGRAKALARHADGHTRAWLLVAFAEEAAETGDVGLCEWALEDAGRALDTAAGDAGGFFSPQGLCGAGALYLRRVSGRVAGLAGRFDEAESAIGEEVIGAVDARQRVNALCALGTVRIDNSQPEGACTALVNAVDDARSQGCLGKLARVHAVRRRMDPIWDALDCVIDLDERLRAVA